MGSKNYVCVTCGQDFTRKYSAYRHNSDLHEGGSKIVRTLEYIIGRITGEYFAADPIAFRKNRKKQATTSDLSNFPFANVAHDSENSHRNDTTQNDTTQDRARESNLDSYSEPARILEAQLSKREQIKSLYKKVFPDAGDILLKWVEFGVERTENESMLDYYLQKLYALDNLYRACNKPIKEEVPLWRHPYLNDLPQEARAKLTEIEQTMYKSKALAEWDIFEKVKWLGNEYRVKRDLRILNSALDYWTNKR